MTAAFVPTFTRTLTARGRERRLASRQPRHQRAAADHRRAGRPRDGVRRRLTRLVAASEFSNVPGKLELTTQPDAGDAALPHDRRGRGGDDGDAELAAPLLHPGAVAGDVQRRDDPLRGRAGAGDAAASACRRSWRSRSGRCSAGSARLRCSGRCCGARASATGRSSTSAIPSCVQILRLMGPGTLGARGGARSTCSSTPILATSAAAGRGLVAELCLPADVPPDRPVRRLDCDRGAAGHLAPRGRGRPARRCAGRSRARCG